MKAATGIAIGSGKYIRFQSTPPVKAATEDKRSGVYKVGISIHAAREGGDEDKRSGVYKVGISIHAAREGGDLLAVVFFVNPCYFNPRRP